MNFNIEFFPHLPWFVIIAFAVIAACLVAFMIYKMQRGSLLRGATAVILGLALTNPILRVDQRQALSDIAIVIVDQSTSWQAHRTNASRSRQN
jgi:hypothetical protein